MSKQSKDSGSRSTEILNSSNSGAEQLSDKGETISAVLKPVSPGDAQSSDQVQTISPEQQAELDKIAADFGDTISPSNAPPGPAQSKGLEQTVLPSGATPPSENDSPTLPPKTSPNFYSDTIAPTKDNYTPHGDSGATVLPSLAPTDPSADSAATVLPSFGQLVSQGGSEATVLPSQVESTGVQSPNDDDRTVTPGMGKLVTDANLDVKTYQIGPNDQDTQGIKKSEKKESAGQAKNPSLDNKFPHVPGYEINGELGRGGMGVVYRARQRGLGRNVALKMILGSASVPPELIDRFKLEAQAVASLKHPAIVQVYEVSEFNGAPFFSLEYVDGMPMDKKLAATPQPHTWSAKIISQLAQAMDYAHKNKILHRDLKPANVLLTKEGEPKITDFGLAKKMDSDDSQTQAGSVMGTPSYMPPEQAEGRIDDIGPAADIYSLGGILYECLTGRPPFKGATFLDTLKQVMSIEPVPPITLQPNTPIDLQTISLKCLEKDPAKRYLTAGELAEDLNRYVNGEPILARPVPWYVKGAKWANRHRAKAALIAVSAAFLFTLLLGMAGYIARSNREFTRLSRLRNSTQPELLKAQALFEEKNFNKAKELLAPILAELKNESALEEIKQPAQELLQRTENRIKAQEELRAFATHYDEALFQSAGVLGDLVQSHADCVKNASLALQLLGVDWQKNEQFALKLPDYLAPSERDELKQSAFELCILIARQFAFALPGATEADIAKNNETALGLINKAKGLSQGGHLYHATAADIYRNLGKEEEAKKEESLAANFPLTTAWEFFLMGQRALDRNDLEQSHFYFTQAQRADAGLFWPIFFSGVCYSREEKWDSVGPAMNACIGLRPTLGFPYLLRAITEVKSAIRTIPGQQQAIKDALTDLGKAQELGLPEFHILVNRGVLLFELGQVEKAQTDFEKAMGLNPNDPRPVANLALCFRKEKQHLKAIELFNKCVELNPQGGEYYHWRGLAYLELLPPEKDKALADFSKAGNLRYQNKDKVEDYLLAVDILYRQKKLNEAVKLASFASTLDQSASKPHLLQGLALVEINKFAETVKAIDKYFSLHKPERDGSVDPRAYLARGNALRGMNQLGPALADLSRAVELLPADTRPRARRGMLLTSAWKNLAEADFSTILEAKDPDPLEKGLAFQMRGYLRATQNNLNGAIEDAQAAQKMAPPSLQLYLNLAGIFSVVHGKINLQEEGKPGREEQLLSSRKNAFILLEKALKLAPAKDRKAIWTQAIEPDDSFDPIRKGKDYADLKANWLKP